MPIFPQQIRSVSQVSAAHTAATGDVVIVTTGAVAVAVTLPPVAEGGPVTVRKIDAGTGALSVVSADGSTINGIAGATGVSTTVQYAGWTFVSDGAHWWQTAS
jgi:hypothetical protein